MPVDADKQLDRVCKRLIDLNGAIFHHYALLFPGIYADAEQALAQMATEIRYLRSLVWTRPTAEAYAKVCRSRSVLQDVLMWQEKQFASRLTAQKLKTKNQTIGAKLLPDGTLEWVPGGAQTWHEVVLAAMEQEARSLI